MLSPRNLSHFLMCLTLLILPACCSDSGKRYARFYVISSSVKDLHRELSLNEGGVDAEDKIFFNIVLNNGTPAGIEKVIYLEAWNQIYLDASAYWHEVFQKNFFKYGLTHRHGELPGGVSE